MVERRAPRVESCNTTPRRPALLAQSAFIGVHLRFHLPEREGGGSADASLAAFSAAYQPERGLASLRYAAGRIALLAKGATGVGLSVLRGSA